MSIAIIISLTMLFPWSTASALSDPTKPAYLKKKKVVKVRRKVQKPLSLNSTLVANNRRVAIINNKVVVEGDKVDNALVLRISRHSVKVKRNKKEFTLRLKSSVSIRKSAALRAKSLDK